MNKIKIPAEELLSFGGIEYCLAKKNLSTLQDCEVTLTGKPGALEMLLLGNYLYRNKITLIQILNQSNHLNFQKQNHFKPFKYFWW